MDGPLCNFRSHLAHGSPGPGMNALDDIGVKLLNMLCDSETFFVLSSSWRKWHDEKYMTDHLRKYGWTGKFHKDWKTPVINAIRGVEIQDWLNQHPDTKSYVIIDDDRDMLPEQKRNFVKVDCCDGILWKDFQKAAKILFGNDQEFMTFYRKHKHLGMENTQ